MLKENLKAVSNLLDSVIKSVRTKPKKKRGEVKDGELFWQKQIRIQERQEKKVILGLRTLFDAQEKEIVKRLKKKSIDLLTRYSYDENRYQKYWYEMKLSIPALLLGIKRETKKFVKLLTPIFENTIIEVADYTSNEIDIPVKLDTEIIKRYLKKYPVKFSKEVNKTTNKKLRKTLAEGIKNGESIYNLEKRIRQVFSEAEGYRANRIARTEVSRASNFATVEVYKESGVVKGKEWLTAMDERTCELCESMNGKIVDIEENFFDKGDKYRDLKISYDNVGFPPLHVSCRCTVIPVVIE